MAFCGKCGIKVDEGVKFCPECGYVMAAPAAEQQPPQQPADAGGFADKVGRLNDTADTTEQFDRNDVEKNKMMAVLAYILFFIPLLAAKESPFARFHANQGLVLFLGGLATSVVLMIPILGWLIAPILSIVVTILAVIGIINALNGKAKELPLIGKFKILK